MRNPFNHPAMVDISLLLARCGLGLYMLVAGWGKLNDVPGFVQNGFLPMKPGWLPESIATPYGYALPFAELICGLALVLGLFTRISAGLITLMLLSIAIAVVGSKGITGGAPGPFHHSLVLMTLAFLLSIVGPGRLALDPLYFTGGGGGGGGKS